MLSNEVILTLRNNQILATKEEVRNFDIALSALTEQPLDTQISLIPEIFFVFNDSCIYFEVMWGLLHYVESLGIEEYVPALVEVTPELSKSVNDWLEKFYIRLLISENGRVLLRSILLHTQKDILSAVDELLAGVATKHAGDFTERVAFVLSKNKRA